MDAGVNFPSVRGLLNVLSPTHPKQLIPRIPTEALFILSFIYVYIYIKYIYRHFFFCTFV